MTRSLIFLLICVFSITAVNGHFPLNLLFSNLHDAGKVEQDLSVTSFPEDLSLNDTLDRLRNTTDKVNNVGYSFDKNALKFLEDSDFELLKYGDIQNISEIMEEFSISFIDIDVRFGVLSDVMHQYYITNMTVIDSHFEKLIAEDIIKENLRSMYSLVNGLTDKSPNLFILMGTYMKNYETGSCSRNKLTQAHVQSFYNLIFDKEMKGSFLLISAYAHLTRRGIKNYRHLIELTMENTKRRLRTYYKAARIAMWQAPTEILPCDETYVKNENYVELSGMTQGFVVDSQSIEKNCQRDVPEKNYCFFHPEKCFFHDCPSLGGKLTGCQDLNSTMLQVCNANELSRRYSWVKSEETSYGNYNPEQECYELISETSSKSEGSAENWYCFCNCVEEKWRPGDIRTISLHRRSSDYYHNRVITNLMFEEKNGMIGLRIQEGLILRGGMIDQASLEWKESPSPYPESSEETNFPNYIFDKTYISGETVSLLKWSEDRDFAYILNDLTINLDDIVAPENHVIISVGLHRRSKSESGAITIELEVQTMEFNHTSGSLNHDIVKTITGTSALESKQGEIKREQVNLGAPGHPVMSKQKNDIISKPFQFVKFQQTDWKKDLGQTIVPLIDTRPVVDGRSLAISGVGLYFRGCEKDCGGFIVPKLFTYNYTHHFERQYEESYLPG